MLGEGRKILFTAPHVSIIPGLMIFALVMSINLLGDGFGSGYPSGLEEVLQQPRARVHLYGKTAKPGRKLGHLTLVGDDPPAKMRAQAEALAAKLSFKEPQKI